VAEIRFYLDEHVPRAVAEALHRRNRAAVTTREVGNAGQSDVAQLAYAVQAGCVIVTQDADFLVLVATGAVHPGIVYAPQGTAIGTLVRGLLLIADVYTAEEMVNRVEYI
jgi:predicted nuclease of predicted toxin-antitoxin system